MTKKTTTTTAMPKKFSFYKENVNCFYNFPSLDLYFFCWKCERRKRIGTFGSSSLYESKFGDTKRSEFNNIMINMKCAELPLWESLYNK